jgi:hypothetical protein
VNVDNALHTAIASYYSEDAAECWQDLLKNSPPDWIQLAERASSLGLAPLLYDAVRGIEQSHIPVDVIAALRKEYYDTAGHNLLVLQELVAISSSLEAIDIDLEAIDIDLVVLKGAALILDTYEKLAHRPMVDIDLLIRFDDIEVVKGVLEQHGYRDLQPHPFQDDSGFIWTQEILVHESAKKPVLELHWHLLDNPYYASRLKTIALIGRSQQVAVEDVSPRILNLEDQIVHLCCHNLYHHLGGFTRSLVDIAFLVNKYSEKISWEEIVQQAEEYDLKLAVASTFEQLANEWYTPIPKSVVRHAAKWIPSTSERFFAWSQRNEFLRAVRTFITLPGARRKRRYISGQLFPDREYLHWRYGLSEDSSLTSGYMKRYLIGLENMGRAAVRRPKGNKKGSTE